MCVQLSILLVPQLGSPAPSHNPPLPPEKETTTHTELNVKSQMQNSQTLG